VLVTRQQFISPEPSEDPSMNTQSNSPLREDLSACKRFVRRRACGQSLRVAVRLAAFVFFRFTHRKQCAEALWSATERVWLGSETFFHWAMSDAEIDIPWTVATAADAPETAAELREAVRAELTVYWKDKMASLPNKERPRWLPLP
jgi:hypothetical protein